MRLTQVAIEESIETRQPTRSLWDRNAIKGYRSLVNLNAVFQGAPRGGLVRAEDSLPERNLVCGSHTGRGERVNEQARTLDMSGQDRWVFHRTCFFRLPIEYTHSRHLQTVLLESNIEQLTNCGIAVQHCHPNKPHACSSLVTWEVAQKR